MKRQSGMTLVEILVVLAIIAGLFAFTLSSMGGGSAGRDMRQLSQRLLKLFRYVYDQAALNHRNYRIVFDLDDQKMIVQSSEKPFYIVKEDDEYEELRKENEEDGTDIDTPLVGEEEPVLPDAAAGTGDFIEEESDTLEPILVPEGIRIADIYVEHNPEKVEAGQVPVYFFPRGLTEFAVIHLSDEDGTSFYTLVLNPLTAKVDIYSEYREHEEILEEMTGSP